MRIAIISDTHGLHEQLQLPGGDLLIHCGDFEDAPALDSWFHELDFAEIVVIGGNHDFDACEMSREGLRIFWNATYLEDSSCEFHGLKLYGAPWVNELAGPAFVASDRELGEKWAAIPEDTDILITHVPPARILDESADGDRWGCELLRERVEELDLRFHCFGHVHAGYGRADLIGISFFNAANVRGGEIRNPPIVLDL